MAWMLTIILAAAALIGYMVAASYRYKLDVQTVTLERLPEAFDGTRLLFISDLHRRIVPDEMIEKCREAGGADLVLIGGDLREKGVPVARSRDNIRRLRAIAPVYLVYGNNDHDDDLRPLEVMLEEERVRLLVNESVILEQRDGSRLRLAGVDDPRTKRDRLARALEEPGEGSSPFTILLAHDPIITTRFQPDTAVDLVLCGDTHGGQVVLPLIGPIIRRYSVVNLRRGWFDLMIRKTTEPAVRLFVSCGFGTSGLPIRLGTPAELHIFTLRSERARRDQDRSSKDR